MRLDNLITEIGAALGKKAIIQRLPEQPGDVNQTYADVSKAKERLNYEPCTDISDGLASFVKWFKSNGRA